MIVENPNRSEQIVILVRCAKTEDNPEESLRAAVRLMAQALVEDEELDEELLSQLAKEIGEIDNDKEVTVARTFPIATVVGAVCDFLQRHQVSLPDGRVALRGSWNHDNVPPQSDA